MLVCFSRMLNAVRSRRCCIKHQKRREREPLNF
jgi:hypothetical protein